MTLVAKDSSMVYAGGYDSEAGELRVVFRSGRIFHYERVLPEVFEGLLVA